MMKKLLVILFAFLYMSTNAQVVNEKTKRQFTFGLDIFTDLWQDVPSSIEPKTINPGVNVFGSYNYMFGNSDVSFSPGIGIGVHNLFSDSWIEMTEDSINFQPIPDDLSFRKSKFTATYFDIPIEIRYKSESDFRLAIGFKFGFLMKAQTKYKGDDFMAGTDNTVIIKYGRFDYVETTRYGFTGRIGYKWLNLWGYYQLSTLFSEANGPAMYPISLGITIIPY